MPGQFIGRRLGLLGGTALSGGALLLAGESAGLGIDFESGDGLGSVAVKGHSTNYNNVPAGSYLTQSGTSSKWVPAPSGLLVEKAAGVLAIGWHDSAYALFLEPSATPLARRSRRLDDGTDWTRTNITPSAVEGMDGVSGSATRITATANNATAIGSTNTSASAARRLAPYIRRVSGTGDLEWTLDGGSTWTAFTGITSSFARNEVGQTVANPRVGFRIVSSGDAFDIDFANGESASVASSPIETAASTAARAKDDISQAVSTFPFSTTVGTVFCECSLVADGVAFRRPWSLSDDTTSNFIEVSRNGSDFLNMQVNAGGVAQVNAATSNTWTAGDYVKTAAAWKANDFAWCLNGGTVATDTSGTVPTGITVLGIGRFTSVEGRMFRGKIRNLVYLPRDVANADLVSRTA